MINKYRLRSSAFERESEEDKIPPAKIFFLSVEGNITEKQYFEKVSKYRDKLRINAKVDVEVLHRSSKDTNSAPKYVIELLEEYINIRDTSTTEIDKIAPFFRGKYSNEFIDKFLYHPEEIVKNERNKFLSELQKIGYDLSYRKYLRQYDSCLDEFCIVIDRDKYTHSERNMQDCINHCIEKGYLCFITNPCFEFWLLLHLSDIKTEYAEHIDKIKDNEKVSDSHTFVSKELSKKAGHNKAITHFTQNYLPNIDLAMKRAEEFSTDKNDLIFNIGSNIGELFGKMRETI